MNKIYITNKPNRPSDDSTYSLDYQQANKMLSVLRSDYFRQIILEDAADLEVRNLKFLVQITRLLKNDGAVFLKGAVQQELKALLTKLNLFEQDTKNEGLSFVKTRPEPKIEEKVEKLSIGFNANQEQQTINEDQLLKGENLDISKKAAEKCQTKPRACANCSCGRKEVEKGVSVEQLVQTINQGQVMTGCGKCSLGDSFRCGTCPYKGFPAFKPGDKLRLVEEGGVVVGQAATFVSAGGKIKLEI